MMSRDAEDALLKQLKNPFDPKFVKWRVGATNADKTKGIALAYIDSREVKKRLDDVMGLSSWKDELVRVDKGFICNLYLKIDNEWIPRSNAGEDSNMSAVKGGASDAFKRAASKWGVGHYLYYLPNVWVPIKPQGKSYALTEIPELPDWAKPGAVENWQDVAEMAADVNSGEDADNAASIIENIDLVRESKTEEELDRVVSEMSADQQLIFTNEISMKRRELKQHAKVHADNR